MTHTTGPRLLSLEEAAQALATIRGRARTRTLTHGDLLQALAEARRGPYGLRAGTTVANAYGYPAQRMRLVAIRVATGAYAVLADWGSASRGSSDNPLGGRRTVWERTLASICQTGDATRNWWVLDAREVHRALAARRHAQWAPSPDDREVMVRVDDSLTAGNCTHETVRVAAWWPPGTEAVSIAALRAAILRREPDLIVFAARAAAVARRRTAPGPA